jgi:5-methylcytosine-specific restriction endonuclease McrA
MRTLLPLLLTAAAIAHAGGQARSQPRDEAARQRTHRNTSERRRFQSWHPCPSTGKPAGACPGYIVDHVVPIKRGGADVAENMQWQTVSEAKAKDRVE